MIFPHGQSDAANDAWGCLVGTKTVREHTNLNVASATKGLYPSLVYLVAMARLRLAPSFLHDAAQGRLLDFAIPGATMAS